MLKTATILPFEGVGRTVYLGGCEVHGYSVQVRPEPIGVPIRFFRSKARALKYAEGLQARGWQLKLNGEEDGQSQSAAIVPILMQGNGAGKKVSSTEQIYSAATDLAESAIEAAESLLGDDPDLLVQAQALLLTAIKIVEFERGGGDPWSA